MSRQVTRVELETMTDERGNLTVAEGHLQMPFEVKRIFILHGLTKGSWRGGHANVDEQLLIVVSGAMRVVTHDGADERQHILDSPTSGLLIGSMIWRTLHPLQDDTVLVVLSSTPYGEENYIRDFAQFVAMVGAEDV